MDLAVVYALIATLGTWALTALGAATVFLFKHPSKKMMNLMLGFSAGVMISASFWSLLLPAIERAEAEAFLPPFLVATLGFLCGAVFICISDQGASRAMARANTRETVGKKRSRILLLVLSITLHNIPEGLAVGVSFGALQRQGFGTEALMGAVTVAIGIALQNFPEGAAVSIPLRREGYSRKKSFFVGQASGAVEPIAGMIGAFAVLHIEKILPFALSFAAGTMIWVAVHELIPECQSERESQSYLPTVGIILGFALMMLLDVALG